MVIVKVQALLKNYITNSIVSHADIILFRYYLLQKQTSQTMHMTVNDHCLKMPISTSLNTIRARLHQASASTQSQHCNDACEIALIEINGNE